MQHPINGEILSEIRLVSFTGCQGVTTLSTKWEYLVPALVISFIHSQQIDDIWYVNPLYSGNPLTGTFTNSEDTHEMQHNAP